MKINSTDTDSVNVTLREIYKGDSLQPKQDDGLYLAMKLDPNDKMLWEFLAKYRNLSPQFIDKCRDCLPWNYLSEYQTLSEDTIRKYQDRVCWWSICKFQKLSADFMREFVDRLDWHAIEQFQVLPEDFIEEFIDKFWIWNLVKTQALSESFLRKFAGLISEHVHCWTFLPTNQALTEDFMRDFQDKLGWPQIAQFQNFSKKFAEEFKHKLPKNPVQKRQVPQKPEIPTH